MSPHVNLNTLPISALDRARSARQGRLESALEQILKIDAGVLNVERVSYWSFHAEPSGIVCELGYQATPHASSAALASPWSNARNISRKSEKADIVAVEQRPD